MNAVELVFDENESSRINKKVIDQIRDLEVRVWVNTPWDGRLSRGLVDEDIPEKSEQVWRALIEKGLDIIQTDQPVYLRSYIGSPHFISVR